MHKRIVAAVGYLPSLSISRGWLLAGGIAGLIGSLIISFINGAPTAPTVQTPQSERHPAAVEHAPIFITSPGSTDVLLVVMALVLIGAVLAAGVFFFWLHSLPERLVHKSSKVHFDLVAVLALLSLFTHIHLFWVAALLIALVKIPELSLPGLDRIATSLERMASSDTKTDPVPTDTSKPSLGQEG